MSINQTSRFKSLIQVFSAGFLVILLSSAISVFIITLFFDSNTNDTDSPVYQEQTNSDLVESIAVSVSCLDSRTSKWVISSGMVIESDGLILARASKIPHDGQMLKLADEGCIVGFPQPKTGRVQATYWAHPITESLDDANDFALLQIYASYNKDKIEPQANLQFTSLEYNCTQSDLALGDSVKVYGYLASTNNSGLTVTDGIISNMFFPDSIFTSAQTDYDNFGGVIVDQKNCVIGVANGVVSSGDSTQSFGVITPISVVNKYLEEKRQK